MSRSSSATNSISRSSRIIRTMAILTAVVLLVLIAWMSLKVFGVPENLQNTSLGKSLQSLAVDHDEDDSESNALNPNGIAFNEAIPQYSSAKNGKQYTGALRQMVVGKDIPAGEYFVACKPNVDKAFVEIADGKTMDIRNVLYNNNLRSFTFVTLKNGQRFTCVGGTAVATNQAQIPVANAQGQYPEGTYRIGTDLPAGSYRITANSGDTATMDLTKDSTWNSESRIRQIRTRDSSVITVENGQYLTFRSGMLSKV